MRQDWVATREYSYLCREVAEYIPGCRYEELAGRGHYGYLEEPDRVNSLIIDFFAGA